MPSLLVSKAADQPPQTQQPCDYHQPPWVGRAGKEGRREDNTRKGQSPSKNSRAIPKRETSPPTHTPRPAEAKEAGWGAPGPQTPMLLSPNTQGPPGSHVPLHGTGSDTKPMAGR